MEITIGIADSVRQIVVSVSEAPDAVEKKVIDALSGEVLNLIDDKGRRVIVPSAKIAFVEIGPVDGRRVGFVSGS